MVGDRYFTDVLYGNRHGMGTIRTAPFTSAGTPPPAQPARHWAQQQFDLKCDMLLRR